MSNEASDPQQTGSPEHEHGGARSVSGAEGAGVPDDPGGSAQSEMNGKEQDTGAKSGSFWRELPLLIVIALVLAFVIKTWVVQPFFIPSKSMEDTLQIGDRVLVNKLVYQVREIERGDVVVFNGAGTWDEEGVQPEPSGNPVNRAFTWVGQQLGVQPTGKDYIKRVIGVGGDTVECDDEGRILVNVEPLDEEDYLYPGSQETHAEFGPVEVPEGRLWLMGDHRQISYDSRLHQNDPGGGTIAEEDVIGRAFVLVWPFDRMTTLPIPETFESLNEEGKEGKDAAAAVEPVPDASPIALGVVGVLPLPLIARRLRRRASHAQDSAE